MTPVGPADITQDAPCFDLFGCAPSGRAGVLLVTQATECSADGTQGGVYDVNLYRVIIKQQQVAQTPCYILISVLAEAASPF